MPVHLPNALSSDDDTAALALLRAYYGSVNGSTGGELGPYTGAAFDSWDSTGTRDRDADRFTADDLVAVTLLSVNVSAQAAHQSQASPRRSGAHSAALTPSGWSSSSQNWTGG